MTQGVLTTKTTKVVSATDNARQKILAESNEKFKAVYDKVSQQLAGEERHIFESRHYIGELIDSMRNEEGEYGAKCVERMETAVGYGSAVIYNSLLFFQRYTKDEMQNLLELRNKAGQPLLWTHITHLIRVSNKDTRNELQGRVLDGNLTPSELLNHIQTLQGKTAPAGAGKPLARPKSLRGFIDQQLVTLEQLLKRKNKVWAGSEKPGDKSFFDVLLDTPIEKIDAGTLTDLESLERAYETTSMELDNMATELLKTRKKLERARTKELLDEKEDKEAEPEDDNDEENDGDDDGGSDDGDDEDDDFEPAPSRRSKAPILD